VALVVSRRVNSVCDQRQFVVNLPAFVTEEAGQNRIVLNRGLLKYTLCGGNRENDPVFVQ